MLTDLPSLAHLLRSLQQVPYLASKNIYRVATHFLDMDIQRLEQFCDALKQAKENIMYCQICFFWQEKGKPCSLCGSPKRDQSVVCVERHGKS